MFSVFQPFILIGALSLTLGPALHVYWTGPRSLLRSGPDREDKLKTFKTFPC